MNQTNFTRLAQTTHLYTLMLRDQSSGENYSYIVRRGAVSVRLSGALSLFVNPRDLVKERSAQTTVVKTPHGAWTDSFGAGLPRWTLRGTTGWRARYWIEGEHGVNSLMDGYLAFHALQDFLQTYLDTNQSRVEEASRTGVPQPLLEMRFADTADDDWWVVEPEIVPTKRRSADKPLLLEYECRWTGVRDLQKKSRPDDDGVGAGLLGGRDRDRAIASALESELDNTERDVQAVNSALDGDPIGAADAGRLTFASINLDTELVEAPPIVLADYAEAVDAANDAGIPQPSPEVVKDEILTAGEVPEEFSAAQSFRTKLDTLLTVGQNIQSEVRKFVNGQTSWITTPYAAVVTYAKEIRATMQGVAWTLSLGNLRTQLGTALRSLRTTLRNLLCAVQSLLAFPYNFVKNLGDSLADFFNLTRLSGCASTFPRLGYPSWRASLPLTLPNPVPR